MSVTAQAGAAAMRELVCLLREGGLAKPSRRSTRAKQ
jgi:hypothetical protein